jgi:DNA invertase Pin-like site-specific DNA recombinase
MTLFGRIVMPAVPSTNPVPALQERQPAVLLYRISDDRQDSVPTQRAWAQRVATRDGLTLAGEFGDEGISGADVNRPGLEGLVAFVRERFFAREPILYLLVLDLDRFSRRDSLSTSAWLDQLRKHGLRYIVTTAQRFDLHSPLDRTLIALGSDFTREPELRAKSNHVLNGMAERARKGWWMGGPPPLGYRTELVPGVMTANGRPPKRLVLGPEEEQELVRWIFREYASGRQSCRGIVRELAARGFRPRGSKSGMWPPQTIAKMLSNRAYLGCIVWGGHPVGRYHRLKAGMVVPREDKEAREQHQLLAGLKHLPADVADGADVIVCEGAHPALIDRATWDLCQQRLLGNQGNRSAPRAGTGNVWPLAGQIRCGHCSAPIWTHPMSSGRRRKPRSTAAGVCRLVCSRRRIGGLERCQTGRAGYLEVLNRVIGLLQEKLASPDVAAELTRALEEQMVQQAKSGEGERRRLTARATELDGKVSEAVANLAHTPADLRDDVAEYVRKLKADRDAVGALLRALEAQRRESQAIDPDELRKALEMVQHLSAAMETREEAEHLRAVLRDLIGEVRLYYRPRRKGEKLARGMNRVRFVLRRIEADLTPWFADLVNMAIPC